MALTLTSDVVAACRRQFPALSLMHRDLPVVFLDGPAGTQVTKGVIDAIANYLETMNANHGGSFATSRRSDEMLDEAHRAMADFVGAADPNEIAFGQNMTSLTFSLSRALARTWQPGDEVLVTRLDHDANFTPWVLAARDAGATIRVAEIRHSDCTLDLDDLRSKLSARTKLVAVGCASNSVGTINPVREITRWAHEVGALVFLDAVHYAPHAKVNVADWDCDFLACSAYKFFGPHLGILWGRRKLLEELSAYKVRPAPNTLPGKWMTGTQSHEAIAGALAAVNYLATVGEQVGASQLAANASRKQKLEVAYAAITNYEREIGAYLLAGLVARPEIKVWGIADPARISERFATFSITHSRFTPLELATKLGELGIYAWHGNYYALNLSEALGREPLGMVRLGLVHYNTKEEIDRLFSVLDQLL